ARKIAIEEYLTNYFALGVSTKNLEFYFQSDGPKLKTKEYVNLSKLASAKTTFNEIKAIYGEISPQKLISALTQVADILYPQLEGYKATLTPIGFDQLNHANLVRDLASRMKFSLPSFTFHKLLPGLKGMSSKMSSSDPNNAIFLTDSPKTVELKIKKYAFSGGQATEEEHKKKGGNPEIDISFIYLKTTFEQDDKKLEKIYNDYKSGKLLTSELKQIAIDKINSFLKTHQKNREKARKQVDKLLQKS
ncbi:MAG: tryptophan--tRNA ligase, partial [Nanoarchaeota archaeon]